ncbi:MAG: efflux RND transporter permease subunit, partial [Verrucomicrobiota bacterium]
KNAILIISFAKMEYEKGKSINDSALAGARIRLRPILMTSFAFILGCVPLWLATGSGGMSRETLGTVVIGGMLGATFVDIFIVPVTFTIVEKMVTRISKKAREEHAPQPPEPNG